MLSWVRVVAPPPSLPSPHPSPLAGERGGWWLVWYGECGGVREVARGAGEG